MARTASALHILVKDKEAGQTLVTSMIDLVNDATKCETLSQNMKKLGKPNAAEEIAKGVLEVIGKND